MIFRLFFPDGGLLPPNPKPNPMPPSPVGAVTASQCVSQCVCNSERRDRSSNQGWHRCTDLPRPHMASRNDCRE